VFGLEDAAADADRLTAEVVRRRRRGSFASPLAGLLVECLPRPWARERARCVPSPVQGEVVPPPARGSGRQLHAGAERRRPRPVCRPSAKEAAVARRRRGVRTAGQIGRPVECRSRSRRRRGGRRSGPSACGDDLVRSGLSSRGVHAGSLWAVGRIRDSPFSDHVAMTIGGSVGLRPVFIIVLITNHGCTQQHLRSVGRPDASSDPRATRPRGGSRRRGSSDRFRFSGACDLAPPWARARTGPGLIERQTSAQWRILPNWRRAGHCVCRARLAAAVPRVSGKESPRSASPKLLEEPPSQAPSPSSTRSTNTPQEKLRSS